MITKLMIVAFGGAFGSMARYVISLAIPYKSGFPYATFAANVLGCFLMGIAYVLIVERTLVSASYRELIIVGFLGAFTTFSTFSFELVSMFQTNQLSIAALYIVTSLIFCIVAAFLGASAMRLV